PLADGHAAQCRGPGRRLRLARERIGARRDGCEGHAARRRDQRRLLDPDRFHRDRDISVPDPRAVRQCRRRGSRSRAGRDPMIETVYAVAAIPLVAAILLALVPGYRLAAAGNVLASFTTFAAGVRLLFEPHFVDDYVIVDDLNIFFIVLNTLVAFT